MTKNRETKREKENNGVNRDHGRFAAVPGLRSGRASSSTQLPNRSARKSHEGMPRKMHGVRLIFITLINYSSYYSNVAQPLTIFIIFYCVLLSSSTNPTTTQKEQLCVLKCVDRFRDAEKVCQKKFTAELQRQHQPHSHGEEDY